MKEFENEFLKKIKINSMIIFTRMVYTLFKTKFVSVKSTEIWRCTVITRILRIRCLENTDVFWCLYYFFICSQPSRNVLKKFFQKSFLNSLKIAKVYSKFKQNPWKINVKDFIPSSVGTTLPIIWNAFSCLSKFFPLC